MAGATWRPLLRICRLVQPAPELRPARLGLGFWSLSNYLKLRVKSAVNFIGEFEHAIAAEAKRRNADGVICGHIHHMTDRMIDGIRYINCGDWVESCTAIAEDHDGTLHQNSLAGRPRKVYAACCRTGSACRYRGSGTQRAGPERNHGLLGRRWN